MTVRFRRVGILFVLGQLLPFITCFNYNRQGHIAPSRPQQVRLGKNKPLFFFNDERSDAEIEEDVRRQVLQSRRRQIRQTLKAAEGLRNYRIAQGMVPELNEEGKPLQSDGKLAVGFTAFVVAAGAIALRVGGRAALVSAVGLDFLTDNPELQRNMQQVLDVSDSMDPAAKLFLFTAAWTAVKVLCIDAGGVVLALASGIIFGGVLQGAVLSAAAATVGSTAAFGLAKLDTPVRKKALEVLDEYPSLRGIEKVVAKDGLKAVLTLRLAPVLPIPVGLYNYIYGVTNVPLGQFMGGIFLGSLKPYLLDSYLGYFGKTVVDGSISQETGFQDVLLLVALGFSVLIGVFASQLASETWETVLQEVEASDDRSEDVDDSQDGITREILGYELPAWIVGFQLALKAANERVSGMIVEEYEAKVWNYTLDAVPWDLDPARRSDSPEVTQRNQGIDIGGDVASGLVLSPLLFACFLKYADPLYDESSDEDLQQQRGLMTDSELTKRKARLLKELDSLQMRAERGLEAVDWQLGRRRSDDNDR